MSTSFPASPVVGQTYTVGNHTWTYTGTGWTLSGSAGIADGGILDGGTPSTTAQYYTYDGGSP